MKRKAANDKVGEFLVSSLPDNIAAAYKMIARIRYPVDDRKSLHCQLQAAVNGRKPCPPEEHSAVQVIQDSLGALDFPILTLESGFEKLSARVGFRFPEPSIPPGLAPRFELPTIDVEAEYRDIFPPNRADCVEEAYETYREQLSVGDHPAVAFWKGLRRGKRQCRE